MFKYVTAIAFGLVLSHATLVGAGETRMLRPGLYEVAVKLELPHLENTTAKRTATICVSDADRNGSRGLAVLSENNPLARCPVSNVSESGDSLTFDIACEGGNAAVGSAKYVLGAESFEGRIAMKMGGKNMTMSETQVGRRIGECTSGAPRS